LTPALDDKKWREPRLNEARTQHLLRDAVRKFDLSLDRFSVLTEAASGYFSVTPLLAALGGSCKVYALTRDSRYGTAEGVAKVTRDLARKWGVEEKIEIVFSRDDVRIGEADIVTNLGFVRPIDADLIRRLKKTVAIPLMWETWEFRPQDLDLELCRSRGIPVLGTNEHHPDLKTFGYIGHVVLKLLYELEVEVFKSDVAIVGSGEFAREAGDTLSAAGAIPELIDSRDLPTERAKTLIQHADAIVVLEHDDRQQLIGQNGLITPEEIKALNPAVVIAHICGGVNRQALELAGIRSVPTHFAPARYMSVSTAYLGPRPLIDLHAAGLKVGQTMAEAVSNGLSGIEAEKRTLQHCKYAQGFPHRH
jgi:hypothetical protein